MRERQYPQFETLAAVVRFLRQVLLTNPRALYLKDELLRYYARVKELIQENYGAKLEPIFRRGRRRVTKNVLREEVLFPR